MKLKKLVAITLSAVMCMAALTGCGGKSDSAKKTAKVIEVDLTDEQYAFGVDKDQPDLLKEVNQFVKDMKSDGTFDEICNRYFGDGTPVPVKSAAYDESKDQLVVATLHLSHLSIWMVRTMLVLIWRLQRHLQISLVRSL